MPRPSPCRLAFQDVGCAPYEGQTPDGQQVNSGDNRPMNGGYGDGWLGMRLCVACSVLASNPISKRLFIGRNSAGVAERTHIKATTA